MEAILIENEAENMDETAVSKVNLSQESARPLKLTIKLSLVGTHYSSY